VSKLAALSGSKNLNMMPLQECSASVSFLRAVHKVEHCVTVRPSRAPLPTLSSDVLMLCSSKCVPVPAKRSKRRRPDGGFQGSLERISDSTSRNSKFSALKRSNSAFTAWFCSRCCWMYSSSSVWGGVGSAPLVPPRRSFARRSAV
jgi:hypothetical protein